jgi:hypothetical protein
MSDQREPDDLESAEDEEIRRLLQGMPEVSPPDGFFDDLIKQRHRKARIVAGVGWVLVGVGFAIVVAQATGITGEVAPRMGDLAARHSTLMSQEISTATDDPSDMVGAPYQVPDHLGQLSPGMAVRHPDDVVQVVYGSDGQYVSLFEQVGDLSDEALASDLTPLHVDGVAAWRADDGSIVVRRAHVVYVLIGDIDPDDVAAVIADLPNARRMGLADRIGDAMDDLVDAFGLG